MERLFFLSTKRIVLNLFIGLLGALPLSSINGAELRDTERRVQHELVMLPYYGVFDNLAFRVEGPKVVLLGQVNRPSLKKSAERVVARLEGVEKVENLIEILPTSSHDDRIRMDIYRAIYYHPSFTRYAIRAVPPLHIIVKNGNVTLTGLVATEADKNLAGLLANAVPGVFSVTNSLAMESE